VKCMLVSLAALAVSFRILSCVSFARSRFNTIDANDRNHVMKACDANYNLQSSVNIYIGVDRIRTSNAENKYIVSLNVLLEHFLCGR
jgi:hypothetical protein